MSKPEKTPLSNKHTILVVDDDPEIVTLLSKILLNEGYNVMDAQNGRKALRKVEKGGIDLVILDLIMPGIDGFEFLKLCKKNPLTQHIPVAVLTIRDSPQDIETAKRLGAEVCLIKHKMRPKALLDSVRIILGE